MEQIVIIIFILVVIFGYLLPAILVLIDGVYEIYLEYQKLREIKVSNILAGIVIVLLYILVATLPIVNWVYVKEQVFWIRKFRLPEIPDIDFVLYRKGD